MEHLEKNLQENLLILAVFDDKVLSLLINTLKPELFDNVFYRAILNLTYDYYHEFKSAPKEHVADLVQSDVFPKENDHVKDVYIKILQDLYTNRETVNKDYVLSRLNVFIRQQNLKTGIIQARDCVVEGRIDEAELTLSKCLNNQIKVFEPGFMLTDLSQSLNFLHNPTPAYPIGIDALDKIGFGPVPGELFVIMSPANRGKCISLSSRIWTIEQGFISLNELITNKRFMTLLGVNQTTNKIQTTKPIVVFRNGKKKVCDITLQSGRVIQGLASTHPILTNNGYKPCNQLTTRDLAIGSSKLPLSGTAKPMDELISFAFGVKTRLKARRLSLYKDRFFEKWVQLLVDKIYKKGETAVAAFMAGFFNLADLSDVGKTITFSGLCRRTAEQIVVLLNVLGIYAIIRANDQLSFDVIISNKEIGWFIKQIIPYSDEYDQLNIELSNHIVHNKSKIDFVYDPIINITWRDKKEICWDIETLEKHQSFYCEHVFTHNSQFAIHMAKVAALNRLKVLFISLEMSTARISQRFFQSMFSIPKRESEVLYTEFQKDELGRLNAFSFDTLSRPTLQDQDIGTYLAKKMSKFKNRLKIRIKQFPTNALTIKGLEAYLDSLERFEHYTPDLVIIDYADLMHVNYEQLRISTGHIYKELRRIAVERMIGVVTPSQSNRLAEGAKIITLQHLAEDYSKAATSDNIVVYCQTEQEQRLGLARLMILKARDEERSQVVLISQAYAMSQFCMDSVLITDRYWDLIRIASGNQSH